jgi:hypothetical protein
MGDQPVKLPTGGFPTKIACGNGDKWPVEIPMISSLAFYQRSPASNGISGPVEIPITK